MDIFEEFQEYFKICEKCEGPLFNFFGGNLNEILWLQKSGENGEEIGCYSGNVAAFGNWVYYIKFSLQDDEVCLLELSLVND